MLKGKRRSSSQRIGTTGEAYFRLFAERHGLIANKCEQDFGTDFLCQVEGVQEKTGVAPVIGGLLGAFVRTTKSRRGRIRLHRKDIEHLLICEYPICVVLIHLPRGREIGNYFSFVDEELGEMIADFLERGGDNVYLTPSQLKQEFMFEDELSRVLKPGSVEQFRIRLAAKKLDRLIPHTRVQVRRAKDGSFTLVKIRDFFSQFPNDLVSRGILYKAVFGHEDHMFSRFRQVPILPGLIESLSSLPFPVAITGPLPIQAILIEVVSEDGSIRACTFELRSTPGYMGWVHHSGFAITISESELYEGKWIHRLQAQVDPDVPISLSLYEDLWMFLEGCELGAKLQVEGKDIGLNVDQFRDLLHYGFLARYLRLVTTMHQWPEGTWYLGDATNDETLNTLALLFSLAREPERLNGLTLILADRYADEIPIKAAVPICMNLPRSGLVVWIVTEGYVMMHQAALAGFKFGEILDLNIEIREKQFNKSIWPEIVINPKIKTIPLVPPEENLNHYTSDPLTWGCGILEL